MDEKADPGASPPPELAGGSAGEAPTAPSGYVPIEGINVPGPDRPQSVGFTISTTGYALASAFQELLEPLELDPKVFAMLASVASSEGVTAAGDRRADGSRAQPNGRVCRFARERGLLERRQNPDDRRARALYLTLAGRELLGRAFAVADQHEQRLTSDLSDEERQQLLELLAASARTSGFPAGSSAMGHSALADELK